MSLPACAANADDLAARYRAVRGVTEALAAPLSPEDQTPQSMPDASPVKWHRAHTSWFFETFVLERAIAGYVPPVPEYRVLFNSYYNAVGEQYFRPERGLVTRPSVAEVRSYREHVDEQILKLLDRSALAPDLLGAVELGLHHEQQHQELIVTDLKHLLAKSPLHPIYRARAADQPAAVPPVKLVCYDGGLVEAGFAGPGFSFDNETPRHRVFLAPFALASRAVTVAEYLEFIRDRGYSRPELWLSDGRATLQAHGWRAPLYWREVDGAWLTYTLAGLRPVAPDEPVTHVSHYEADAFARWAGARLPTELEWEHAASAGGASRGAFLESERFHPAPARPGTPAQLLGDVWEWTASAYTPYPGFRPAAGALGEYNGKFMSGQMVLRGGSCATPESHIRVSYRNFFPPDARWQFSGIRLARDCT